ncbi:MAG: hypothetical protein PHY25_05735, partial [Dehalococcoidales bacterium]|nr:hypothetical protein [Dehalococcoidales bacterium]
MPENQTGLITHLVNNDDEPCRSHDGAAQNHTDHSPVGLPVAWVFRRIDGFNCMRHGYRWLLYYRSMSDGCRGLRHGDGWAGCRGG